MYYDYYVYDVYYYPTYDVVYYEPYYTTYYYDYYGYNAAAATVSTAILAGATLGWLLS